MPEQVLGTVSMIGGGYIAKIIQEDGKYFPVVMLKDKEVLRAPEVFDEYDAYYGLQVVTDLWNKKKVNI